MYEINDSIKDAIASEDLELLKELLDEENDLRHLNICRAFAKGNMEILQAIMEKCPVDHESMANVLRYFPSVSHDEGKKLEMLKYLLPFFISKYPDNVYRFPNALPEIVLLFYTKKHFILADFLINKFYISEDSHNRSSFSLIKKLQATVDGWYNICVFLHEDLDDMRDLTALKVPDFVATFFQLLLTDTRESMELAVEAFQVLLDKHFYEAVERILFDMEVLEDEFLDIQWNSRFLTKTKQALSDPLTRKLLFRLIYNSMNGKVNIHKIYQIMDSWLEKHSRYDPLKEIHDLSAQFLCPFISKPLGGTCFYITEVLRENPPQNDIRSLKELSREIVRCKVFQNVNNVKEFMDRIWEFKLPATVKCFVLHIPVASWMDN